MDKIFSKLFLFSCIEPQTLIHISSLFNPQILHFSSKEIIYSPEQFDKKMGFVINGECVVERVSGDGKTIPLNKLSKNDSFGVVALFGETDKYPTQVRSRTHSDILFFTKEEIEYLIENYPVIAKNLIYYLSKKIVFLNSKIATFSSDTVEQKLASFILNEKNKLNSQIIPFNCKKSAEAINVGRASLYRALASLTDSEYIKLDNKIIYILDQNGLERILK